MDRRPDPETLAALSGLLSSLTSRLGPVRVILFGSRALGTHLKASDYDLILVSEKFRGMSFRDRIIEATREWDGDYRLDVLCYSPGELEDRRGRIGVVAEALRHGIEISP